MDITKLTRQELLDLARDNVTSFPAKMDLYAPNEATYLRSLYNIAAFGRIKMSRPGQYTVSLPGTHAEYDLSGNQLPMPRSKEVFYRSFMIEDQWFLSGSDNVGFLKDRNVSIWDSWVKPETAIFEPAEKQSGFDIETYIRCHLPLAFRELVTYKQQRGISFPTAVQMMEFITYANQTFEMPDQDRAILNSIPCVKLVGGRIGAGAYGPAWRQWEDVRAFPITSLAEQEVLEKRGFEMFGNEFLVNDTFHEVYRRNIDQFGDAVKMLRNGADSRRIIISAWNAAKIDEAALPPCHSFIQFVSYDNFDGGPRDLVCILYQRSADSPIGKVFNINQYAVLTHVLAKITNHKAVKLIHTVGDDHIYADQIPFLKEQFERPAISLPSATIEVPDSIKELDDFINLPEADLLAMVKGYDKGTYHPRVNYPVAV